MNETTEAIADDGTTLVEPARQNMTALQVCNAIGSIRQLGETFAASGFFGAVTPETATAAIVNCFIEGLSPVEYRAKYHTMADGTTAVKSDYMQREFHRFGGSWRFNEWTPEVCDVTFTYGGVELRGRVTLDEFKVNGVALGKNGQLKDNWRKFPREMLKARCMATYIRALCPEALGGLYTQEEAQDFARAKGAPAPVASPSPLEDELPEVVDEDVCPVGRAKGRRFDELDTTTLKAIVANAKKFPELSPFHIGRVKEILAQRDQGENGDVKNEEE